MTVSVLKNDGAMGREKYFLRALLGSAGIKDNIILGTAMIMAGALDYAVNILVGRWLEPAQYGIFVSVTALLQVVLFLSSAIRIVVAFYTAHLSARDSGVEGIGSFLQSAWSWGGRWGLVAMALTAMASPFLAGVLHLPNTWPLLAASLMVLM